MRKHKIAIAAVVLLIVVYLFQSFAIPPETSALSKYQLSTTSAKLIKVTFTIPLIAVWIIALAGYIHFSKYALSIQGSPDGVAFEKLSNGILALALWLPGYTIIQNTTSYLWHHNPSITTGVIVTSNLVHAVLLFAIIYTLWRGARQLLANSNIPVAVIGRTFLYATSGILAVCLIYLIITNPGRFSPTGNGAASFYSPTWLLILCFVVPYTAVWYLGLQSMQLIHAYRRHIKGVIYKKALGYIANGIAIAAISALTIRTLSTASAWLNALTLKVILISIYGLVFSIGIGYMLMWIGSKKLHLIEQV